MPTSAKLEFDVQMTCEKCTNAIQDALKNLGDVSSVQIDLDKQQVLVETKLPYSEVLRAIESTGRKAVLKGYGSIDGANLGAAVSEMSGRNGIMGVVRFLQVSNDKCIIDGTIDGLKEGEHGIHIHEFGDLSNGCESIGGHFNPTSNTHGGPEDSVRHYGDLGNIKADNKGRATFRKEDGMIKVWDIIGRSLAVTSDIDDCGKSKEGTSKEDGNAGIKLACGIIARSSGLFSNPKRICVCDGVSVWDEREKPVAGKSRSSHKS